MEDIVIEERQSKLIRANLLGFLMVVLSAMILLMGIYTKGFIYSAIGGIGGIFFGVCTLYSFARAIKPKALLTIKVDGIEDSSFVGGTIFISFGEIESFEIINVFGQKMIGINLKNVDRFISRLPQMRQKSAKSNLRMKLPALAIRVDTARDMSIEDILTLLEKRHQDYSRLYS